MTNEIPNCYGGASKARWLGLGHAVPWPYWTHFGTERIFLLAQSPGIVKSLDCGHFRLALSRCWNVPEMLNALRFHGSVPLTLLLPVSASHIVTRSTSRPPPFEWSQLRRPPTTNGCDRSHGSLIVNLSSICLGTKGGFPPFARSALQKQCAPYDNTLFNDFRFSSLDTSGLDKTPPSFFPDVQPRTQSWLKRRAGASSSHEHGQDWTIIN